MKHKTGSWVIVTARTCEGPEVELKGKIVEATRDYAIAECWRKEGPIRFTMSDDTAGAVFFRKAQRSDFRRR
jgi:hypothetical protein